MNFVPRGIIPDVSFWQDDPATPQSVDFVKMAEAGVEGVIIRAGQNTWVDRDFSRNWRAAREAGLRRGSYWFFDPRNEPKEQARRFTNLFLTDLPELGLWNDLEYPISWGGMYQGERHWRTFCDEVRANFRDVVGLYTANWWWSGQIIREYEYWGTYPLWVAQYTSNPANVALPRGWTKAVLWQFTDKGDGARYGVESAGIDLNYTSDDFHALFGGSQPPPNGGSMHYFDLKPNVSGEWRSIRGEHANSHIQGSKIGQINAGSSAKALEKYVYPASVGGYALAGDIWWKVYEANGSPISGWCAEIHLGKRYLTVTEVGEPEPPAGAHDMPFTITLGGGASPYVETTVTGVVKAKK